MLKIAFLGLGVMGYPMAGHLSTREYEVTVFNRSGAKSKKWLTEYTGYAKKTPGLAATNADFVFCCVGDDDDLRSIVLGADGALSTMVSGATLIDHSTCSASVSKELYEIARGKGINFIDAPVSGGESGAKNGILTVMCGGDKAAFALARPIILSYAQSCSLMGGAGAGQFTKMVNQICIAGLIQGLSEGLNFAQKAGLNGNQVLDVISKGAAGSWQMDNRGKTMLRGEFDFGFAVDLMRKDLKICLRAAELNGSSLPVTALIDQFYQDIQSNSGGRLDTSSLIKRLNQ